MSPPDQIALSRQRPGTATYQKGRATAAAILEKARRIVIEHGMHALTLRRIAREMNMSPGNLNYYYASKSDLISDLLTSLIEPYLQEMERLREQQQGEPIEQLRAVLKFIFEDLENRETTYFFPELWALALRHDWAEQKMEWMYGTYRSVLTDIITELRPELEKRSIEDMALAISASIEGHTVFIGRDRSHQDRAPFVGALIIEQLVDLAVSGQPVTGQATNAA